MMCSALVVSVVATAGSGATAIKTTVRESSTAGSTHVPTTLFPGLGVSLATPDGGYYNMTYTQTDFVSDGPSGPWRLQTSNLSAVIVKVRALALPRALSICTMHAQLKSCVHVPKHLITHASRASSVGALSLQFALQLHGCAHPNTHALPTPSVASTYDGSV